MDCNSLPNTFGVRPWGREGHLPRVSSKDRVLSSCLGPVHEEAVWGSLSWESCVGPWAVKKSRIAQLTRHLPLADGI